MTDILITPDELAALLVDRADRDDVRVLDVRWRLDRPDGRPEYLAGHIPGAVYVDLDSTLAAHGATTDGRHPLPSPSALQASARGWGAVAGAIEEVGHVLDGSRGRMPHSPVAAPGYAP